MKIKRYFLSNDHILQFKQSPTDILDIQQTCVINDHKRYYVCDTTQSFNDIFLNKLHVIEIWVNKVML
jgi:hypothetical protein